MAEAQLQQFLNKIEQLNAFVALSEAQPDLRQALRDCSNHHDVVQLAAQFGFDIGRRWGDSQAKPAGPVVQPRIESVSALGRLEPAGDVRQLATFSCWGRPGIRAR